MKELFSASTPTMQIICTNLNSALNLSLISLPIAISIVLSLDDRLPSWETKTIPASVGIMTLLLGYLITFFYSGTKTSFRTFTGSQYAMLSDSIAIMGVGCISGMSLTGALFNGILASNKKGVDIFKYFPSHILEGLRAGTCLYMVVPELYVLLRVPEKYRVKEVNILSYIKSINEDVSQL